MKIGKKEVSLIKIILIMLIILVISFLAFVIIKNINKNKTSMDDFKSIKEIVEYLESEYISETNRISSYSTIVKLKFKYLPYNEDGTSNENYYNKMIGMIANFKKYSNFILQDDENGINVKVECNQGAKTITSIYINDVLNYFAKKDNETQVESLTVINNINVNVNSNVLKGLIENNWIYSERLFGSKDSRYEGYDIFFDEGIKVKRIENQVLTDNGSGNKIYNLIFTKKYNEKIINNITVTTSLQDIVSILGTPQFGEVDNNIIGYKTDKFYIFFNSNNEVSIYRIENPNKEEFSKIVTNFINERNSVNLVSRLMELWPDYDSYTENKEKNSKELLYTLYGIRIQFNVDNEHGVILYSNFSGKVTEDVDFSQILNKSKEIPKYVYIKNQDSVYLAEMNRAFRFIDTQFMEQTDKFIAKVEPISNNSENLSVKFISKTDEYPDSELANFVNTYKWVNDVNFVYSRKGNGIYVYNVATKDEKIVIEGNDNFNITNYENNTITYDNDKKISLDI